MPGEPLLFEDIWENNALSESRYFYAELAVASALVYIGDQAVEPFIQALSDPRRYYGHPVIAKVLSEIKSSKWRLFKNVVAQFIG